MTRTTPLDAEAIAEAIDEAMRKVDTRPSVFSSRVPEILAPCQRAGCGAAIGQPCLPLSGEDSQVRARRNHASHRARQADAARIMADLIVQEAQKRGGL